MTPALLAAALALAVQAAAANPLDAEIARMASQGYSVGRRASTRVRGGTLDAVVFEQDGYSALRIYYVQGRAARLAYMEPNPSARVELSSIHAGGAIPDLIGDKSRTIAYTITFSGTGEQTLVLLRAAGGKIRRLGAYPFGEWRDIDGDGRLELVSRDRPLGQFFALECESFRTMAQTAFETSVYRWRGGVLVPASREHPAFFERLASKLQADLDGKDARSVVDYGGYLGSALSLFYTERELGRGREAWGRFTARFQPRSSDPPAARRCLADMESTLRSRLGIPPDW